jgi:uncharacterized SAM-binding protein YcdF (DUF218 family)
MITAVAKARQPKRRRLTWLVSLPAAAVVFVVLSVCLGIVREAGLQELHPADAIVIFGAAEYSGRPSPVFRARLDHAFELFQRGLAPIVITTGGAAGDPDYNEGGVGRDYLMRRGIPERSLIAETQGSDTAQSAERVGVIMRANHMQACVAVSDEYHVYRIRRLLQHEGMKVYLAPRADSRPRSSWQRMTAVLREAVSYLLWRVHLT